MNTPNRANKRISLIFLIIFVFLLWLDSTAYFRMLLAKYYIKNYRDDKAMAVYKKIVRKENLSPSKPWIIKEKKMALLSQAHFSLGKIYLKVKMWPETIDEYRKALELADTFREEIKSDLLQIREACLESGYVHFFLGEIYQKENNLNSARKELEAAIALVPNQIDALRHLNTIYESVGLSKEAGQMEERIISLAPRYKTERNIENKILFLGYDLKREVPDPGGNNASLTFYFKLLAPVNEDTDLYVHLYTPLRQELIINTTIHFDEGGPHFWKPLEVVKKKFYFVAQERDLKDYSAEIGLWDHKNKLEHVQIDKITLMR